MFADYSVKISTWSPLKFENAIKLFILDVIVFFNGIGSVPFH